MFDSSREDQKQEITMQENTMTENHAKPERLAAANRQDDGSGASNLNGDGADF